MANQLPASKPLPAQIPPPEPITPSGQKTHMFNVTLTANAAMPVVNNALKRRLVSISCGWGAAVVRFSVTRADMPAGGSVWPRFPVAGQWLWTLEPGEGLWVQSDIGTDFGGCLKDVP